VGQFALVYGVRQALRMGPLSPMWCALNLSFVPVILFAQVFLREPVTLLGILAVAVAVVAVILGSLRGQPGKRPGAAKTASSASASASKPRATRMFILYGLLLFGLLAANSVINIGIKELGTPTASTTIASSSAAATASEGDASTGGTTPVAESQAAGETQAADEAATRMTRYGDFYFVAIYFLIFMPLVFVFFPRRRREVFARPAMALGIGSGLCSVGGIWMLSLAAPLPAAYVFTVSSIVNILLAGLISVIFFRERADRYWTAMMICALVSVLLIGVQAL